MSYICNSCQNKSPTWTGKCFRCNTWGAISKIQQKELSNSKYNPSFNGTPLPIVQLDNIQSFKINRILTGINEFNRVIGGGLVPGAVILIGGEPGIGKSTLLLQVFSSIKSHKTLYITAEESTEQVQLSAKRLNINNPYFLLSSGVKIEDIIATLETDKSIKILIIDSIQTVSTNHVDGLTGAVGQIKGVSQILIEIAKKNNITVVIIGHITKDGNIAGPKLLEHMVDTVLYFESDIQNQFRILRAIKHRHGSINEIGVFEMSTHGLKEINNPSEYFLTDRKHEGTIGTSVFAGIEGNRPILLEFQALLASSNMPMPRRSVVGWDTNRLAMIIAILSTKCSLLLNNFEVYLSIAGGIKIIDPASDLPVAVALISSLKKKPISNNTLFFGEISLSGDIRKSRNLEKRISEAIKMGFKQIVCRCENSIITTYNTKIQIININKIQQLLQIIL